MCAGWRTFSPHKGNDCTTYLVVLMVRHPRGSYRYVVLQLLSLEVAIPEIKITD